MIENLPDNKFLPPTLRKAADEWREAAKRVGALKRIAAEAGALVKRTELEDAEALRAAIIAGDPLPAGKAEALRQQVADADHRLPVARDELYRLGEALAVELHKPENRAHIAAAVRDALVPAVEAYAAALDNAEKTVSAAHAKVSEAASLLSVVRAIDNGKPIAQITHDVAAPAFGAARTGAEELSTAAGALVNTATGTPKFRRVKLDDGRVLNMPLDLVYSMLKGHNTDRRIIEWLDGYGEPDPEQDA
ncbi:hypothetical protein [Actinacidiphila glaucinigra]|uniref:hypothetical protein n=1 Tax=Actinacidiphila glaucinigra TaxID=235986 RepID=UPI00380BEDEE